MSLPAACAQDTPRITRTAHAMLVPWGFFARQMGLVQALERVPLPQRKRWHTPQTKLIEFLVAILGGCAYLQDISRGPHPLDQDQTVAEAWGQPAWADYSGVSRTLNACQPETVTALRQALAQVTQPFIDGEVVQAVQQSGKLLYDGDLTGRPVSSRSTTYEGASFGWMDDAVQLGYQAALVSMASPTYGRLWLSVTPHPGDVVSSSQAEALVRAAEARTGVRPRRRTELLAQRIAQSQAEVDQAQARLERRRARCQQAWKELQAAAQQWRQWQATVAERVAWHRQRGKPAGPYSRLAKARHKVGVCWRRLQRRNRDLTKLRHLVQRQEERVQQLQAEVAHLQERLVRFTADNQANRSPMPATFRLDGGFGTGENVALLIELGYEVYGKAYGGQVTQALRRRLPARLPWTPVGDNAEMVAWSELSLDFCPYPLDIGLEHFYTGSQERYATLLHYGPETTTRDLPAWFAFYNRRQSIEAGVKEGKQVFQMHHLKVRSAAGLAIQEEFAVLAANLVRWASHWLQQQCPQAQAPFNQPRAAVKQLVRVAANTTAWVFWQSEGDLLLMFDELSPFPGLELRIGYAGAFQLPLPWFKSDYFEPF
jgi:hypothetical protein